MLLTDLTQRAPLWLQRNNTESKQRLKTLSGRMTLSESEVLTADIHPRRAGLRLLYISLQRSLENILFARGYKHFVPPGLRTRDHVWRDSSSVRAGVREAALILLRIGCASVLKMTLSKSSVRGGANNR